MSAEVMGLNVLPCPTILGESVTAGDQMSAFGDVMNPKLRELNEDDLLSSSESKSGKTGGLQSGKSNEESTNALEQNGVQLSLSSGVERAVIGGV
jgi:hypothetical protein